MTEARLPATQPIKNRAVTGTVPRSHWSPVGPNGISAPFLRLRFWAICGMFSFWLLVILGKLFFLQVLEHREYAERAEKQQQRAFTVAPRRGVLYDRNLRELAMTVQAESIYAVPSEIPDKAEMAQKLAAIVHTDPQDSFTEAPEITARMNASRGFAWVARRPDPSVSAKVKALNLKGIYFQKEFQRFYPDNEVAAQVLGYVGTDDTGLGGLEQKFDSKLHGASGRMYTALDARRHVLGSTESEPKAGQNLILTIDGNIQFMAERALDHAMEQYHADNGTVVVQDVHTGHILALAIRPTFNPNLFRHTTPALLRDHAISDVYEPGSTFKLVTYSAALDQGAAKPTDKIDCQGGAITLAGRVIHDDKSDRGLGVITVEQALEKSSDVAAVKLALKVGNDRFYQYIRDFGFGSRSGLELPGETRGLLRPPARWNGSSIGSLAIGQEVGVTPVQLVSMVSTIANGGTYLPPHILMPQADYEHPVAQPFHPGGELVNPLPGGAHRVISTMTAAMMRKMMESVVLYGTGRPAQLNGYSSGGKTGTAQKIDPATHTYSKTMHIASFAGIAPVNNPVIAVAVVVDNPKGGSYYGTAVSAPVFAEVAQQVLEYLGVPHDIDIKPTKSTGKVEVSSEDNADEDHSADVNALYAAVNELPADDSLRAPQQAAVQQSSVVNTPQATPGDKSIPGKSAQMSSTGAASSVAVPQPQPKSDPSKTLSVPNLTGLPIRRVVEQAAASGLSVQIVGTGTVREQAPAPGTMVAPGTQIVVRCGHSTAPAQ